MLKIKKFFFKADKIFKYKYINIFIIYYIHLPKKHPSKKKSNYNSMNF